MTFERLPVTVRRQVIDFIRQQSPESRHRLRLAVRGLANDRGDVKAMEGDLEGFHRLRVGPFRVVFQFLPSKSGLVVDCVFAERRSVVYLLLEELLRKGMLKSDKGT